MPGPGRLSPGRTGRTVRATAPVRVCDVGGWTDTWFGSPGRVCSVAVGPAVTVEASLVAPTPGAPGVRLRAPDLGVDRRLAPADLLGVEDHPLIGHAIAEVLEQARAWSPGGAAEGLGLDVRVSSAVPPGASLGTSAAVVVALLGAVEALVCPDDQRHDPAGLAVLAHRVEVGRAGREAGVQDGWAAALGGALELTIGTYPEVRARAVELDAGTRAALAERLVTVAFGSHDSSAVHGEVIQAITGCSGADHDRARSALRRLGSLAGEAAVLLGAGALDAWGELLVAATDAQAQLHPSLVGEPHRRGIELARSLGATGWKVNGAGGDGGSLTVLSAEGVGSADDVRAALAAADPSWQVLDLVPCSGIAVAVAVDGT